jgi:hypothetical protein
VYSFLSIPEILDFLNNSSFSHNYVSESGTIEVWYGEDKFYLALNEEKDVWEVESELPNSV